MESALILQVQVLNKPRFVSSNSLSFKLNGKLVSSLGEVVPAPIFIKLTAISMKLVFASLNILSRISEKRSYFHTRYRQLRARLPRGEQSYACFVLGLVFKEHIAYLRSLHYYVLSTDRYGFNHLVYIFILIQIEICGAFCWKACTYFLYFDPKSGRMKTLYFSKLVMLT